MSLWQKQFQRLLVCEHLSFSPIWRFGTENIRLWSCKGHDESIQGIPWILYHPWPQLHFNLKVWPWEADLGVFRPDRVQPGSLPHHKLLHCDARLPRLHLHLDSPNLLPCPELQKAMQCLERADLFCKSEETRQIGSFPTNLNFQTHVSVKRSLCKKKHCQRHNKPRKWAQNLLNLHKLIRLLTPYYIVKQLNENKLFYYCKFGHLMAPPAICN